LANLAAKESDMTEEKIIEELKNIIKSNLEKPELLEGLKPDSNLIQHLKVDSVDLVEIVLDIEEQFGIRIEDHRIKTLQTPQDIVDLIKSKQAAD